MAAQAFDTPRLRAPLDRRIYFAVWRWHFYAGLYVIPFITMLAVTGMVMLWFTAVSPEYGEFLRVTPQQAALPASLQLDAALALHPASSAITYIAPWGPEFPAIVRVAATEGSFMVAVDPYTGAVLRQTAEGATWKDLASTIHGSLLLGDVGDRLIEIAAGFGIILVFTGLVLWWPRDRRAVRSLLVPDLGARGRALWKSLHQVTGFWFSLLLVFFLVSGLAWTGVWGTRLVQAWSTFPAEKWDAVPVSQELKHEHMNHGAEKGVPWALEQTAMPLSGSDAGVTGLPEGQPVTVDAVARLARDLGFAGRFQLALPRDATGVYTISQDSQSYDSTHPTADRTVHVDRYTGRILADVGFGDYSVGGRAMAVGIALHEGTLGAWNVALNAVYLAAILLLVASGLVMWWKRRPTGTLRIGAPPPPAFTTRTGAALALMLGLSLVFPLTALVLIAVLTLDVLVIQRVPLLARLLG